MESCMSNQWGLRWPLGSLGWGWGAAVASPMTEWSSRERPRLETQTVGVVRV